MKKNRAGALSLLRFAGYMIAIFALSGEAATSRGVSRDLGVLQACVVMINEYARLTLDTHVAVKTRMADYYDLTLGQVDGLLGPDMSYGDLAAVLAFADKMSGGATETNINTVIKMRQSGLGWDRIAADLHLKLSSIARSLSRFEDKAHADVKQMLVLPGSAAAAAGGTETSGR